MLKKLLLIICTMLIISMCGCGTGKPTDIVGKEEIIFENGENIADDYTDIGVGNQPSEDLINVLNYSKELKLGDIKLGIGENEFRNMITSCIEDEHINDEYPDHIQKICILSDGTEAVFVYLHDYSDEFTLYSLETTSKNYMTTRGLAVEDSVAKVYELYGEPFWEVVNGNYYYGGAGDYINLSIIVENEKVAKIRITHNW